MAGTSYTRQSTITDGNLITASLFNNEYNQLLNAFVYSSTGTTGHTHDGTAGQGGAIGKIGDQDFNNKIEISATNNRIECYIEVGGSPVEQLRIQDGAIVPVTDSDIDLGTTSLRFKDAFVDSLTVTGVVTATGFTIGSAVITEAELEILDGKTFLDEDDLSSDSATGIPSQQSVKAYVDAQVTAQDLDLTDGTTSISIDLDSEALSVLGGTGIDSTASGNGVTLAIDSTVATLTGTQTLTNKTLTTPDVNTPDIDGGTIDGAIIGGTTAAAGSFTTVDATGNITVGGTVDGRDVAADGTKLDTVETNADVTDTTNVTAAGALMDSEVTNLAQVKAFDSSDYATAAQGTTADAALPRTGGAMTGAITTNSTFDGRDVATDGTKLDGIEAGADVTDTANVTAAGALMDSELTSEASVKALNQGVATTDSPTFVDVTATSLDISGNIDVDGTTNLDVVDIDGAVDMASTLTVAGASTFGGNTRVNGDFSVSAASGEDRFAILPQSAGSGTVVFSGNAGLTAYEPLIIDFESLALRTSGTPRLSIASSGAATFSSTIASSVITAKSSGNTDSALIVQQTGSTDGWGLTPDNTNGNLDFVRIGGGAGTYFRLSNDGSLSTPTLGTSNVRFGVNAGNSIVSGGNYNTVVGDEAGTAITTGDYNTAVGANSLSADTLGSRSVALGFNALAVQNFTSATDAYNVAVGHNAGVSMSTGTNNTLIGGIAGGANTTADNNTAVGYAALTANTIGFNNTAVGSLCLDAMVSGDYNVAMGTLALTTDASGNKTTAIGYGALYNQNPASGADVFNTAVGFGAGSEVTTGIQNTLIGGLAGDAITTSNYTVAVGYNAAGSSTTGHSNSVLGRQALFNNTTGSQNVAVGRDALEANTSASNNTAVGFHALVANTTGEYNTAVGSAALGANTTASYNSATGHHSLKLNTTGSENAGFGSFSLQANTTGGSNTAVGYQALDANTTASNNTAVGRDALVSNTTGANNVAIGKDALDSNTTGGTNVAVGLDALQANTTASDNVGVGHSALEANTTGASNTAVGKNALAANSTGHDNVAMGINAMAGNTTASYNVAMGFQAMKVSTTGDECVAIGAAALDANTTGDYNVAVGSNALGANTTGAYNVAVGKSALLANTTGSENIGIGQSAGSGVTTGYENICIGRNAGESITTGIRNTIVGDDAYYLGSGSSNTIIGRFTGNLGGLDIRTSSNNIVLSDGDGNPRVVINSAGRQTFGGGTATGHGNFVGEVGSSSKALMFEHTVGGGEVGSIITGSSSTAYNTSSDYRLKENIEYTWDATTRLKQLKPARFNFILDETNTLVDGFIAHEAATVVPESVSGSKDAVDAEGNPDYQGIDQSKLIPLLVKTIQELEARITTLEG